MSDFNNNDNWSNRNWQDAGKFGGNSANRGFGFGGFSANNTNDNQNGGLFSGMGSGNGKIGSGWMQGRNSTMVIIIVLVIIIVYTIYSQFSMNASITKSTVERTKIESTFDSASDQVYTDEYGAVEDVKAMRNAAKEFHARTGVIPYIYFVTSDNQITAEELNARAEAFYKENFTDEDHFVVFFDGLQPGYLLGTSIGKNAQTVMDAEALQIFNDFLSQYYEARQTNNQTYMTTTLKYTAERIMSTANFSKNTVLFSAIVIVILIAVIIVTIVRKNKEKTAAKPVEKM